MKTQRGEIFLRTCLVSPRIFLLFPEGLHIFKHIKYDNFMSEPSHTQYIFMLFS